MINDLMLAPYFMLYLYYKVEYSIFLSVYCIFSYSFFIHYYAPC